MMLFCFSILFFTLPKQNLPRFEIPSEQLEQAIRDTAARQPFLVGQKFLVKISLPEKKQEKNVKCCVTGFQTTKDLKSGAGSLLGFGGGSNMGIMFDDSTLELKSGISNSVQILNDSVAVRQVYCYMLSLRNEPAHICCVYVDVTQHEIWKADFNFEDIGIGGLNEEFSVIFRRIFNTRTSQSRMSQHIFFVAHSCVRAGCQDIFIESKRG